jgi:predicted amidohydrolase
LQPETHIGFGFDLHEKFWAEFRDFARAENCEILIGSVPLKEPDGGKVSNATMRVTATEVTPVYRKIHLFDVDVKGAPPVRESEQFRHGESSQIIEVRGWRIGLAICYDLRFAELFAKYAREGAHLLLIPSAFLVPTGKAHWHVLMRARAIESQAFVVAAAQSGVHRSGRGPSATKRETFGHSLAIEPWGRILKESKKPGPAVFIAELDPELLRKARMQIPMAAHRRL